MRLIIEIPDEVYNFNAPTVEENFENHKLVNNSQELVKDLVKEKNERPKGEWKSTGETDEFYGLVYKCTHCGKEVRHAAVTTSVLGVEHI